MRSKELSTRARQISDYVFEHPDLTYRQIAKDLGLHPSRIGQIMRSERILAMFPLLARRRIKQMVPKAISTFDSLLSQKKNLEVARKVSESVLNSEKVLEPTPLIQVNVLQQLSDDELRRKIEQSKMLPNQSIDTELA